MRPLVHRKYQSGEVAVKWRRRPAGGFSA